MKPNTAMVLVGAGENGPIVFEAMKKMHRGATFAVGDWDSLTMRVLLDPPTMICLREARLSTEMLDWLEAVIDVGVRVLVLTDSMPPARPWMQVSRCTARRLSGVESVYAGPDVDRVALGALLDRLVDREPT